MSSAAETATTKLENGKAAWELQVSSAAEVASTKLEEGRAVWASHPKIELDFHGIHEPEIPTELMRGRSAATCRGLYVSYMYDQVREVRQAWVQEAEYELDAEVYVILRTVARLRVRFAYKVFCKAAIRRYVRNRRRELEEGPIRLPVIEGVVRMASAYLDEAGKRGSNR